jgi:tRNA(fMet)-specific endonuclease VapC
MNRALVDTDILSEILRARNANVTLRHRRYVEEHGRLCLSVVSVFEVARGWYKVGRSDRVDAFVAWLPRAELLGIDAECARLAGEIEGFLERVGRRVGIADVLIAALAFRCRPRTGADSYYARKAFHAASESM